MGCGSSVAISEDPEKFPTYLLFQFTSVVIKTVSLQRNDQLSKEHVFQIKLELYRCACHCLDSSPCLSSLCQMLTCVSVTVHKWTFSVFIKASSTAYRRTIARYSPSTLFFP